ncbi:MAG: 4'-phosphopantetheinyl transferase superfamily protein [Bacteroidota bacterium]
MTEIFAVSLLEESAFEKIKPALMLRVPEVTRVKIESFMRSNDAQRSLLGELLARDLLRKVCGEELPDKPFSTGEKGKPGPDGFKGIHFNISHSGIWVVVALSPVAVGIDVERMRRIPEGVAARFFSEKENRLLQSAGSDAEKADIFFTLWTLKESFLKAIGKGLTKNLNSFTVVKTGNQEFMLADDPEAKGYLLKSYYLCEDYKLAACSAGGRFSDEIHIVDAESLSSLSHSPLKIIRTLKL